MPIERGKIREYALATGADRSIYMDDENPPIPPTFLATVVNWTSIGQSVLHALEVEATCAAVGVDADIRNLLSMEQEYVFFGPLPRAGETLQISERLHDVVAKAARSGPMVVIRFVLSFHDDSGELRAECWYTSAYVTKEKA